MIEDPEEELVDGEGILGLPAKFSSWRPFQSAIVTDLVRELVTGKDYVVAELPTGSGKTMISMAARQILDSKTLYVCTTKTLQDQFLADFPHAKLIKGRANYPCGQKPDKFPEMTADDCPASKCPLSCPYAAAKSEALHAQICVMNMSYFLSETQHIGSFKGRALLVIDEADTLEDALLDSVSVQITEADIGYLNLGEPEFKTKFESWKKWAEMAKEKINSEVKSLAIDIANHGIGENDEEEDWSTVPITLIRKKKKLQRLGAKLAFFLKHVDQYWVWDRVDAWRPARSPLPNEDNYHRQTGGAGKWVFKPVRVDQFGDIVFKAGQKFILMSATILDFAQYERNVGLEKYREEGRVGTLKLGSVFDPSRRPIIVSKGVDLSFKHKETGLRALPAAVAPILAEHANEKGLIHAVTYEIAKALQVAFPDRVLIHTSSTRREVIERFKASTRPLVLVSPSADRGEDFPDDLCRFIILVKIPYPYLGDERIKRRLFHKDGQKWYTLKTVSKIVQMTGRGMRHEQDSCTSYILDTGFRKLYQSNRSLFPQWWRDAIIWEDVAKKGGTEADAAKEADFKKRQAIVQADSSAW